MASATLKKNYRCSQSLQQFYSGGPFVVSSDGSFIACACGESIKIVDSSNASTKFTIEAESSTITALALSPNDKLLFSAGHSRQIKVWDLDTFKCLRSWKGHDGPVMGMACHGSGGLLATSGADRKVLVWDVDGGFCTHYFKGHKGVVTSIMFHPDVNKSLLFSGSDDTTVRVWDLLAKKCVAVLEKHFSAVSSMAVSEDGWTLLTAGRDKVVNLWDLHDCRCKSTIPTYEVLEAVCIVYSGSRFASSVGAFLQQSGKKKSRSTGIYFITAGERGIVRIWTSEGAVCLYEQKSSDVTISSAEDEDSTRGFTSAVMLPLDQGLLCVTADQQFLFYSPAEHLEEKWSLKLTKRLVGFNDEIVDMKFLDEEEQYLAVATNLEQVRVYDLSSMSCSYVLAGHTDTILCLDTSISSNGRRLILTGSKDNSVRLWESERRCCIGLGIGHMGAVGAVAFSKKCRDFFVSGSSDRTIKVWNFDGLSDDIEEPISLKAKAVVAAHDKDINSLAVAPNDSLVCSGSQDRTACVWRLPELVLVVKFTGHKRGIWCVEFSPVDQCVITASGDKTVKIWAIADGSCLKTFEGHTSSVLRASFLTRGTQFVSCGADGLVKLWTIKTNECIATYDQHEDKVWALAVGKKTEMLATGGSDAVINLWRDSTAAEKEEAFRKEEEGVLRGQELENALLDAEYTKAIQIALELRRPHKLFELFSELCRKRAAGDHIDKALHALGKEEFLLLFEYIREWNTKPKLCHVAQSVLFRAFNILPPTEIIEIKGISELLEGLIPYSQRHFSRIDRLIRSTFLLDYTLLRMSVIEPRTQDDLKTKSLLHSEKNMEDAPLTDNAEEDQKQVSQEQKPKASGKKRKSHKSGDHSRSHKKVKDSSTHANTAAVPLQA
ncbi:transducin beta-like protein 3 [Gossypium australe]|uniref:Transducin beta-like protein 3 n=1 Tax=Gossypium australe TaxID=47621 RepID=A0A5B6X0J9_9ROSI|nr:transducin beta-like protein 3 [Gossypium australe]